AGQVKALLKSNRAEVRTAAAETVRLLGLDRPPPDPKELVQALGYDAVVARAVQEKGDAVLGGQLFLRQNCIACPPVSKNEPPKGPYLGDVAGRYQRPELLESILKPNAKIAQGFETHVFTLADGKIVTGFVVREAGDEVEIRDANGTATVLKKEDIDDRRQTPHSMMPETLPDR